MLALTAMVVVGAASVAGGGAGSPQRQTQIWFAPLPRDTGVGSSLGLDGSRGCGFSRGEEARQFAAYAAAARAVFPHVIVGDIEALPPHLDAASLVAWMDTFRRVTGSALPFIHLDLSFRRLDWPQAARLV